MCGFGYVLKDGHACTVGEWFRFNFSKTFYISIKTLCLDVELSSVFKLMYLDPYAMIEQYINFNHYGLNEFVQLFSFMVNFTLQSTTNEMISISTLQTSRSWVVIFHLRRPMACLSLNLYDTPGLAPRMNVLFWGPGDFQVSYSNRDTCGTLEIVIQEVLWSIRGSYSAIWSNPLTDIKWHSDPWPTVTSQPIRLSTNFMTFIPILTFTE